MLLGPPQTALSRKKTWEMCFYNFRSIILYFSTICFFVSMMSRFLSLKFTSCHVTSSSSYPQGVIQQSCVALTVTTQMVQLACAHGANETWGESHHLFFSLQLPFFPSVNVCHSRWLCPSPPPAASVSTALPRCLSLLSLQPRECVLSRCC